jgi:putative nucleotidyltransferase with HDIG domain
MQNNAISKNTSKTPDAETLIADCSGLISPPEVCVRLYNLIHASNSNAQSIGDTLALDPNLVARVLKIVNSAAYNFPKQISTVSHAVTILGTEDLCNLVMAIAAVRAVSNFGDGYVTVDEFWHHSVFVGLCARHLAQECKHPEPDPFFIAGLLHDIGILVIYSTHKDLSDTVNEICPGDEQKLAQYEQEHFGFDHGYIGGMLLESWHLPEKLIDVITHHHKTQKIRDSLILYLADLLATTIDSSSSPLNLILDKLDDDDWAKLGINQDEVDFVELINEVKQEQVVVLNALTGN